MCVFCVCVRACVCFSVLGAARLFFASDFSRNIRSIAPARALRRMVCHERHCSFAPVRGFTDVFSCSSTRCVCCVQVALHGSLTQARVAVRTLARRLWSAPRRWCYHFQGHCHLRREQARKCHVERGRFSLRATRSRTLSAHRRSILRGPCRDRRGV